MFKVSFVLPAYKRRFLKEAIDSILAQTYHDFELVVVDDCSPEDLKGVVDGFADPRVRYMRNETNLGGRDLVAAWQKALSYATCEWVVLASDDDVYAPTFLERMVALAERHPSVDLVHCRVRIVDAEGCVCGLSPVKPEVESAIELLHARVCGHAEQFVPEFLFRRARLEAIGGFVNFPKAWYSDEATWTLMAANGCANCNETLFTFRFSGINISTSYTQVFDLVDAGVRYYAWARDYLSKAAPGSDEERFLLAETGRKLENRVLGLITEELDKTTFRERLRVLSHVSLPHGWKRRYLCHLLKRMLHS